MQYTLGLMAAVALAACTGKEPSTSALGTAGGGSPGAEPSTPATLTPANLDEACSIDAPSPQRILRLSVSELLASYGQLGAIDGPSVPQGLQRDAAEAPAAGLAVTRDFHADADAMASRLAAQYTPQLACSIDAFGTDEACTSAFLSDEGGRLLRGKRDPESLAGLGRLAAEIAQRSGGRSALEYALRALLLSPASLYMTEGLDEAPGRNGTRRLGSVELASYLSFRITGGPPSSSLLLALEANPDPTAEQLSQLVATEFGSAGQALDGRFLPSWLGVPGIARLSRDQAKHPQADSAFMQALADEAAEAVRDIALDETATFSSLLTKPHRSTLAGDAASVAFERWGRPGVFALPGILAKASSGNHTNIPRRGRFLVGNLFCEVLPSPPAGAAALEPPPTPGESERARFERVGELNGCGGCHARLHPFAFAFEVYDELGTTRERDEYDNTIDATASYTVPDGAQLSFEGPRKASALVAKDPLAQNCFVLQRFRHVARRDERGTSDACVLKRLVEGARAQDFQLASLAQATLIETALLPRAP